VLNTFLNQGYIHLKQVIPQELLKEVRTRSIQLKNKYKSFEGKPRHNGSGTFWKGLELASTLDPDLWKAYTSNFMFEIAKKYLQKEGGPGSVKKWFRNGKVTEDGIWDLKY